MRPGFAAVIFLVVVLGVGVIALGVGQRMGAFKLPTASIGSAGSSFGDLLKSEPIKPAASFLPQPSTVAKSSNQNTAASPNPSSNNSSAQKSSASSGSGSNSGSTSGSTSTTNATSPSSSSSQSSGGDAGQSTSSQKTVSIRAKIYWLVPSGQTPVSGFESGLPGLIEKTRQFYAGQLGGKTFQLDGGVNKIQSSHIAAWFYGCDGGECGYADHAWREANIGWIWDRTKKDLATNGINVDAPNTYSIVIVAPGTYAYGTGGGFGFNGSGWGANASGGMVLNGDQKTAGAMGLPSGEQCEPVSSQSCINQVTGAFIHEVGHSFGLPHPSDSTEQAASIMWSWWNYPSIGLVQREKDKLLALPVIGDR